jgi:hypothetical protein
MLALDGVAVISSPHIIQHARHCLGSTTLEPERLSQQGGLPSSAHHGDDANGTESQRALDNHDGCDHVEVVVL